VISFGSNGIRTETISFSKGGERLMLNVVKSDMTNVVISIIKPGCYACHRKGGPCKEMECINHEKICEHLTIHFFFEYGDDANGKMVAWVKE
jgi:hypothetical protein